MARCALHASDPGLSGHTTGALQLLPGEATEPKGWSIRISPKRFPTASSNHVQSSNGHGAVEFEASGGISIHGSYSHTITVCASPCPADSWACNCTLNQLKFNLQQHPAVIICQRCCRNPSPLWSRAYVVRWLLCFYRWKRAFVGVLGLKNQIVQLKVALQSLPVAPRTLESPADFVSSGSSQAPRGCFLQPLGPTEVKGAELQGQHGPGTWLHSGSHFWFGSSFEQKGRVCVCVSMGVVVHLILIKC